MDNWYEKLAKDGWLGTKAKMSADTGRGDWSSKKAGDQTGAMKRALEKKKMPSSY